MQAVLYSAGLGDVLRVIYQTGSYKFLSETTVPIKVICASHNPFTLEIFRYHRNNKNLLLYELGHKYDQFHDAGLRGPDINKAICEFAGVDYAALIRGKPEGYVPQFDAPDPIQSEGHIVFQPFAGSMIHRTLPPNFIQQMVDVLRQVPRQVFLVTRSYTRIVGAGRVIHAWENARQYEGGNITVLEHHSVPAVLNLIKSCSAYLGCWSSLQQAAWFENKPVAVAYPPQWHDVEKRTGYAFGLDREDCFHADFQQFSMEGLAQWLSRYAPAPQ
jgi:hypothetical protein